MTLYKQGIGYFERQGRVDACDAVVSPANSFGFMNGGIDLLYSRHLGWQLQERLQAIIRERHHGELLVGAAEIVETGDQHIPYLIAAPTMRMPMTIKDSVYPYLAARATCLLWKHGTFIFGPHAGQAISTIIHRIALPGLGTGVGSVEPEAWARQLRAAIIWSVCLTTRRNAPISGRCNVLWSTDHKRTVAARITEGAMTDPASLSKNNRALRGAYKRSVGKTSPV